MEGTTNYEMLSIRSIYKLGDSEAYDIIKNNISICGLSDLMQGKVKLYKIFCKIYDYDLNKNYNKLIFLIDFKEFLLIIIKHEHETFNKLGIAEVIKFIDKLIGILQVCKYTPNYFNNLNKYDELSIFCYHILTREEQQYFNYDNKYNPNCYCIDKEINSLDR